MPLHPFRTRVSAPVSVFLRALRTQPLLSLALVAMFAAVLGAPCAQAQTESVLASFTGTSGAAPGANTYYGNLIQASDGNFYGLTYAGGANGGGAAFQMTPAGAVTLLHSFAGTADGRNPLGSLVQGTDGNFYGLTYHGGANNVGAAFQMTPAGAVTLRHSFAGGTGDGEYPSGSLVQGTDGNFYGLTQGGGANSGGTAFQMTPAGAVTLLHSFYSASDGYSCFPSGSLVQGTDGNFYGLTEAGGANSDGSAFKMTAAGTVTLLHSFAGAADGQYPYGSLVQGTDGNFYGLTEAGGANGNGALLQMTTAGTVTLLHSFGATGTDGLNPYGSLVQGLDGNFYGMTQQGGSSSNGVIFKQTTAATLAAPVILSSTATTVYTGGAFTLTYSVANAYTGTTNGTNAGSSSLGYCFASNTAGNATWTGVIAGSPTAASSASLTAPSTAGTYTYSLTCGGMESNLVTLTVTPPQPVVTVPSNLTVEATGPAGAVATYTATATDTTDGTDPVTCSPVSGSTFALGTTQVTCTATDSQSHQSSKSFTVTVQDTTGPVITVPANKTVAATAPYGAVVTYTATAVDAVDGSRPVSFSPVSGSTFALGTTQVTCTSTDTHSNQSRAYFTVTITDVPYVFLAGSGNGASLNAGGIVASSATAGGGIGAAIDSSGTTWSINSSGGGVSTFTPAGALGTSYTGIGLSGATALAIDGSSKVLIANGNGKTTVLSNAGAVVSTTQGSTSAGGSGVAVDLSGNVWVANPSANSVDEIIGGASPAAPLATAVQSATSGTRP